MWRITRILLTTVIIAVSFFISHQARAEEIRDFHSEIQIQTDSTINVQETIIYDFGDLERHGIFRILPKTKGIQFDNFSVTDDAGSSYPFQMSQNSSQVSLKIGQANKLITGQKTYVINYRSLGAIGYFQDHDELYWNVTGNEWPVAIDKASAHILLPAAESADVLQIYCYVGPEGSKSQCQEFQLDGRRDNVYQSASFFQLQQLATGGGLTVALGWPKGRVVQTTAAPVMLDKIKPIIQLTEQQRIIIFSLLPLAVACLLLWWWKSRGKGPQGKGVIIPQYDAPENVSPAEVTVLMESLVSGRGVTAEIIDLARQGYLKIIRTKEVIQFAPDKVKYTFQRLKEATDLPEGFDSSLFKNIFSPVSNFDSILGQLKRFSVFSLPSVIKKIKVIEQTHGISKSELLGGDSVEQEVALDSLKNIFPLLMEKPKMDLAQTMADRGYIMSNATGRRALRVAIGGFSVALSYIICAMLFQELTASFAIYYISFAVSLILTIYFTSRSSVMTAKGAEMKEYIKGLKMYLEVAEKDRLEFHNAPEKNPQTFEKLLPYAIALGVEKQWAKQFENITMPAPSWYSDPTMTNFNSLVLVNQLSSFSTTMASVVSPSSGSGGLGGGGSSGGGGGGGGGGSW